MSKSAIGKAPKVLLNGYTLDESGVSLIFNKRERNRQRERERDIIENIYHYLSDNRRQVRGDRDDGGDAVDPEDPEGRHGWNAQGKEISSYKFLKASSNVSSQLLSLVVQDRSNVQNFLLDQPDVMPRLNKRILSAPTESYYLDLTDVLGCKARKLEEFLKLEKAQKSQCMIDKLKYLTK